MAREIGSEFHKVIPDSGYGLSCPRPGSFVFSGRTAVEAVLKKLPDAHSVLIPSYCCESMIIPFKKAGFDIRFYHVDWNNQLTIKIDERADILYWCNYFGFNYPMPSYDGVIIEDITHSFFSQHPNHSRSDFLVASIRKWEPIICGGYCSVKMKGKEPPVDFVKKKIEAMELKAQYLKNLDDKKKTIFLQMFSESNHWLADNYSGLAIDQLSQEYIDSVDMKKQRRIRRENAKVLYEGLKNKVQFMFPIEDMDCPLFVPVILPERDLIRIHLIKNDIYCPVHWPKLNECESNIYNKELSLICDQRYGIEDMERIVSVLQEVL